MNFLLRIRLQTTVEQHARLLALQVAFAEVCNTLAPIVQRTVCWNRVTLHHLAYRAMRLQYPTLGSQMICNAIYSVSRASRLVYQHPQSPFNLQRQTGRQLPLLRFLPTSPVYFDRHTLSLKDGKVSMYTLDGRMRFNLPLSPEDEARFRNCKLREIALITSEQGFALNFSFGEAGEPGEAEAPESREAGADFPEHLVVMDESTSTVAAVFEVPASVTAQLPISRGAEAAAHTPQGS